MTKDYSKAYAECEKPMDYTLEVGGNTLSFDVRRFDYDFTEGEPFESYLTKISKTADLYKALHID
jgi:hypothetical protein